MPTEPTGSRPWTAFWELVHAEAAKLRAARAEH